MSDEIKDRDLIDASKDTSLGFAKCAVCGCELEMTRKFAETVGISSTTCIFCQDTPKYIKFLNQLAYYKSGLKLTNEEVLERLRKDGYYV